MRKSEVEWRVAVTRTSAIASPVFCRGAAAAAVMTVTFDEGRPVALDGETVTLAEAQLHAPGYTLRGGTNEILRSMVARGLGLR